MINRTEGHVMTTETVTADTPMLRCIAGDVHEALSEAVNEDHPCDDSSCDIAEAMAHGFTEVAANLLMGATETPAIWLMMEAWPAYVMPGDVAQCEGWPEWLAHHQAYGVRCKAWCNGYTYRSDDWYPKRCGHCGAPIKRVYTPPGEM
jgi:hypothetical protein